MTQGGRNVVFVFLMVSLEAYHFCFLIFMMNQKTVTLIDLGDYVVMRNWWSSNKL
jgi:hypothetical protein